MQSVIVTRATTIVMLHLMVARARHKDPTTVVQAATDVTHAHRSTTAGAPLPRAASSEMYAAATTMEAEEVVNRG